MPLGIVVVVGILAAAVDGWAWQPLPRPAVPQTVGPLANPIDAFIAQRRQAAGLQASPRTDRRSLVRRLSFDLIGLPPAPEEIDAFLADDRPDAVDRLVDRYLASPQYGLRWARPWLELARFDDDHPDAWPYPDWVVQALNQDMPYAEFVRRQLAGDLLNPNDPGSIEATGFLVAGVQPGRDALEGLVGKVGQTFLGLTVQCARCHDHKLDPIPQADYDRLASALAGVRPGVRDLGPLDPAAIADKRRIVALRARLDAIAEPAMARLQAERRFEALPEPFLAWDFTEPPGAGPRLEWKGATWTPDGLKLDGTAGYAESPPIHRALKAKTLEAWVRLASTSQRGGAAIGLRTLDGRRFDAIGFGEVEPGRWMAGSEGHARTQSFHGPAETDDQPVHVALAYHDDGKIVAYRNGQPYGDPYPSSGPLPFLAGEYQVEIGLRPGEGPLAERLLAGTVVRARVYDHALSDEEAAASARAGQAVDPRAIAETLPPDARDEWNELRAELARTAEALASHTRTAYVVTPQQRPGIIHRLVHGNPKAPAEAVAPGGLGLLPGADFGLPTDAPDADRRRKLAEWITGPAAPLLARTIANRVWGWHFGHGLAAAPSDLGARGGPPSHPELLDWLAVEFLDHGGSLKHLHRLIVTSNTYAQASAERPEAMAADVANRWLWRKAPTRLDAATLHDARLAVAGADRRTLDQAGSRGEPHDAPRCPDPSMAASSPTEPKAPPENSITPELAERVADRIRREAGDDPDRQIVRAYRLAFGRSPSPVEQRSARSAIDRGRLEALVRDLFHANEFLVLD